MHYTTQTRLRLSTDEQSLINELMGIVGQARRVAARKIWVEKVPESSIGPWLGDEFGIRSRHAEGIKFELSQLCKSWREHQVSVMKKTGRSLAYHQRLVHENGVALADAQADFKCALGNKDAKARRIGKLKSALFTQRCALDHNKADLCRLTAELDAGIPKICFGTASLAREREKVGKKGSRFATIEAWKEAWSDKRDGHVLMVGSGDEPFGNTSCRLDPVKNTLTISLAQTQVDRRVDAMFAAYKKPPSRLPNRLQSRRIVIKDVKLPGKQLKLYEDALENGQPIMMKLVKRRNPSGDLAFYLHVGFEVAEPSCQSNPLGIIGLHFDARCCAWAAITADGNLREKPVAMPNATAIHAAATCVGVNFGRTLFGHVEWCLAGEKKNSRTDRIRKAAKGFVALASNLGCSIGLAVESFERKSAEQLHSKDGAKMVADDYKLFHHSLARAASCSGIEIVEVNPNGAQVSGAVKFASLNALSIESATAMVIARKAIFGKTKQPRKSAAAGSQRRHEGSKQYNERVAFPRPMPIPVLDSIKNRPRGIAWEQIAKVLGPDVFQWRAKLCIVKHGAARPRPRRSRKVSPPAACGARVEQGVGRVTGVLPMNNGPLSGP
ncbi:MAG: hypothetical protein HHJ17_00095 [Rhodoferax sp.]|uniref:hypothetical protein n=1 Tax=Rhodoferax sp. TaxID=50421 RepID=UPI00182DB480|nr:hypothetical protein [Rhodoferax sp.]NMM11929.1 hypothetical protein [Rhodoferax sp.]